MVLFFPFFRTKLIHFHKWTTYEKSKTFWIKRSPCKGVNVLYCGFIVSWRFINALSVNLIHNAILLWTNREVENHVYVQRQTQICTTWPSFLLTSRLQFILSTHKWVVSRNVLSIRIVLSCFLSAHFPFWETLNLNLTFAVCRIYVTLKLSIVVKGPFYIPATWRVDFTFITKELV